LTTARANWFTDDALTAPTAKVDPLASSGLPPMTVIDLKTPEPKLERMMSEMGAREAALYAEGVECSIKEIPASLCASCPLSEADPGRAPLCKLGREQEQVHQTLLAKLHGR
jgi:hypothetical protein